jgi:hypothetical protein
MSGFLMNGRIKYSGVWSAGFAGTSHRLGPHQPGGGQKRAGWTGSSVLWHRDRDETYNAMLVRKHKKGTFRELIAEARASQECLLEFLNTVPPENFNKDFGVRFRGYKVTVQRLLEAERGDEQTHLQQIMNCFKDAK